MEITDRKLFRRYKAGYEVWDEIWSHDGHDTTKMRQAYNPDGDYIGSPIDAHRLCVKRGIAPQPKSSESGQCSIGFSLREQKWYGWSHRAIYGFGVGDEVKEGDCCASSGLTDEYLDEHPEEDHSLPVGFKAKTLDDAKRMAVAFADSVS